MRKLFLSFQRLADLAVSSLKYEDIMDAYFFLDCTREHVMVPVTKFDLNPSDEKVLTYPMAELIIASNKRGGFPQSFVQDIRAAVRYAEHKKKADWHMDEVLKLGQTFVPPQYVVLAKMFNRLGYYIDLNKLEEKEAKIYTHEECAKFLEDIGVTKDLGIEVIY